MVLLPRQIIDQYEKEKRNGSKLMSSYALRYQDGSKQRVCPKRVEGQSFTRECSGS